MTVKDAIRKCILLSFRIFPINKNAIYCHNFHGKGYDENPRAIVEKLRTTKHYKIYWALSKNNANLPLPNGVERVIIGSLRYYKIVATSKIWISNVRLHEYFTKRKGQFYIQTWHGDLGIKKIEFDAIDNISDYYKRCMLNDNKMIDIIVSGSDFFTNICRTAFRYTGKIIQCGSPKNDPLLNLDHKEQKARLRANLGIQESNILLYMPTFRTDYSLNPYDINLDQVKKTLEETTRSSWKIICKMHPNVPDEHKTINCSDYVTIDNYNNTQAAIVACDILITDYSSVSFDAMLANRAVFIYAKDEEQYTHNERGLYFKPSDLPFPYFKTTNSLVNYVKNHKLSDAKKRYNSFIKEKNVNTSGKAAASIADIVKQICSQKN